MQSMIALYYCYPPTPIRSNQLKPHVTFHQETCNTLALGGRIRVSEEGINGVLSGTEENLHEYERRLRKELIVLMSMPDDDDDNKNKDLHENHNHKNEQKEKKEKEDPTVEWLDMKYCQLRKDVPVEKQLFDSLSVKITREVVSLIEPTKGNNNKGGKNNKGRARCRQRRKQRRKEKQRMESLQQQLEQQLEQQQQQQQIDNGEVVEGGGTESNIEEHHEVDQPTTITETKNAESRGTSSLAKGLENVLHIGKGCPGESSSAETCTKNNNGSATFTSVELGTALPIQNWEQRTPAVHLSPQQWNEKLLQLSLQEKIDNQSVEECMKNGSLSAASAGSDAIQQHPPSIGEGAVLLDTRNVYETRVGHFAVPYLETFFPNTRKFSSLPNALNTEEAAKALAGKQVFMYCTGGVRCERAGSYLRALSESNSGAWKDKERPKGIYQLHGGIQKYLESYGREEEEMANYVKEKNDEKDCILGNDNAEDSAENNTATNNDRQTDKPCLYRGKNFVFDPRRTDPLIGNGITNGNTATSGRARISLVGQCIVCSKPHDDYDNGHAPCEEKEARCFRCRVLVLVCDGCREKVRCWGEPDTSVVDNGKNDEQGDVGNCKRELFCGHGGRECIDEGNVASKVETARF